MSTAKIKPDDIIAKYSVAELCNSADSYFTGLGETGEKVLMGKPFTMIDGGPYYCQRLGVVLEGLRLGKTMKVLDFGAGTCWLSRYLNKMGCSTISVDPSVKALEIGKRLFKEYSKGINFIEEPEFILFEGYTIPVDDESVDRIVCFDAFHHVPNQEDILKEFLRILKPGGIVGFAEPGLNHSKSEDAQNEMKKYDILENDISAVKIIETAVGIGFTHAYFKPLFNLSYDMSFEDHKTILHDCVIPKTVSDQLITGTANMSDFFLTKGAYVPDSRQRYGLRHNLQLEKQEFSIKSGKSLKAQLHIVNNGSAVWLSSNVKDICTVKVGAHLLDSNRQNLNIHFFFSGFESDIPPGAEVFQTVEINLERKGDFDISFDLLLDKECWFEDLGSRPALARVKVE